MDRVSRTLCATESLLNALEEDDGMLRDTYFIQKLAFLRIKHKETAEFLSRLKRAHRGYPECAILNGVDVEDSGWEIDSEGRDRAASSSASSDDRLEYDENQHGTSSQCHNVGREREEGRRKGEERRRGEDAAITTHTRQHHINTPFFVAPSRSKSIHDLRASTQKRIRETRERPRESGAGWQPAVTVPRPFAFETRQPIPAAYSNRFVQRLIEEQRQKEEEEQRVKPYKFKAHPVPVSTYVPDIIGPQDRYVESIRRRLATQQRRKSKSTGDLTVEGKGKMLIARPPPLSTYVAPSLPAYRRERDTAKRAVDLLQGAHTPPGIKAHGTVTHVRQTLRHRQCRAKSGGERRPVRDAPDFAAIHKRAAAKRPPPRHTLPDPFVFHTTHRDAHRHSHCVRSVSPLVGRRALSAPSRPPPPPPATHSLTLRHAAIKKKLAEQAKPDESTRFWAEREAEMEEYRVRLRRALGEGSSSERKIREKTEERRRNMIEATREYKAKMQEMKDRVRRLPLVVESAEQLARRHTFEKKYEQRMHEFQQRVSQHLKAPSPEDADSRRGSGGTFTMEVKTEENNEEKHEDAYEADKFDSESTASKSSKKSTSSSSSSSSTSFSSSSASSSSSSHSSSASKSSKSSKKSDKSDLSKISEHTEGSSKSSHSSNS